MSTVREFLAERLIAMSEAEGDIVSDRHASALVESMTKLLAAAPQELLGPEPRLRWWSVDGDVIELLLTPPRSGAGWVPGVRAEWPRAHELVARVLHSPIELEDRPYQWSIRLSRVPRGPVPMRLPVASWEEFDAVIGPMLRALPHLLAVLPETLRPQRLGYEWTRLAPDVPAAEAAILVSPTGVEYAATLATGERSRVQIPRAMLDASDPELAPSAVLAGLLGGGLALDDLGPSSEPGFELVPITDPSALLDGGDAATVPGTPPERIAELLRGSEASGPRPTPSRVEPAAATPLPVAVPPERAAELIAALAAADELRACMEQFGAVIEPIGEGPSALVTMPGGWRAALSGASRATLWLSDPQAHAAAREAWAYEEAVVAALIERHGAERLRFDADARGESSWLLLLDGSTVAVAAASGRPGEGRRRVTATIEPGSIALARLAW